MKKRTALITGASSGIGREFARRLAAEGYDLIICGRRIEKLQSLARQLELDFGTSVDYKVVELSNENELENLLEMAENHGQIHVLVNSAGFGSGVGFCQNNLDKHLSMMRVHMSAAVKLAYAVLPQMTARREGTIINVSSLAAFTPAPGSTMYSATKSFLLSFTQSLYMELRQYGIHMQCLCPGLTRTDFFGREGQQDLTLKSGLLKPMDASTVVDISLKSLGNGKVICVPGTFNKLLAGLALIMPRRAYYNIMKQFAGQ